MRLHHLLSIVAAVSLAAGQAHAQRCIVYRNTFEGQAPGALSAQELQATWRGPTGNSGVPQGRVRVVRGDAAFGGGRSLRVDYPRGGVGPEAGGALWVLRLGRSYDELYSSYRVRFRDGFDFVLGGKLPGLAGGAGNSGGVRPNGRDGWSARAMWTRGGRMIQYVYHPDQPGPYGQSMEWREGRRPAEMVPGRWHHVEQRVAMNTPGRRDGVLQVWLDGELVLDRRDLRWRDAEGLAIDAFHFATFFGGAERRHAPTRDETVWFDDVVVSTFRVGPRRNAASDAPDC